MKKAVDCYVEALKLNPFMWDAYLDLCDIGTAELFSAFSLTDKLRSRYPTVKHLQNDSRDASVSFSLYSIV